MATYQEYYDLISKYRDKMAELRIAEKKRKDPQIVLFIDKKEMIYIKN